jgi:hypothetical protein
MGIHHPPIIKRSRSDIGTGKGKGKGKGKGRKLLLRDQIDKLLIL